MNLFRKTLQKEKFVIQKDISKNIPNLDLSIKETVDSFRVQIETSLYCDPDKKIDHYVTFEAKEPYYKTEPASWFEWVKCAFYQAFKVDDPIDRAILGWLVKHFPIKRKLIKTKIVRYSKLAGTTKHVYPHISVPSNMKTLEIFMPNEQPDLSFENWTKRIENEK